MSPEELERLWQDPQHWKTWCYSCKADPRVIVPKRNPRLGWTVNAAHPWGGPMVFVLALLSVVFPLAVVMAEGTDFSPVHFVLAIVASIILISAICGYLTKIPVGKVK